MLPRVTTNVAMAFAKEGTMPLFTFIAAIRSNNREAMQ